MSLAPMPDAAWLRAEAERRKAARAGGIAVVEVPLDPVALARIVPADTSAVTGTAYTERRAGRMNKTETRYAARLDALRAAGEIAWTEYEGLTFTLPGRIRWTPDFPVQRPDGSLELHEVKGRKGDTYYATEKARLKLRLAAEVLPFPILVVWPGAGGEWCTKRLNPQP